MDWQVQHSTIDQSVNFTKPFKNGLVEARYVRRTTEYFACYLSSHSGCNKACRFCHLTQTRQTSFDPVNANELEEQVRKVMWYYKTQAPAERVNYNFMARGEVLDNPYCWDDDEFHTIYSMLDHYADEYLKLKYRINFSTIMPSTINTSKFVNHFKPYPITWYYSLYSLDPKFRKRWVPNGLHPNTALDLLKALNKPIVLHWAFIEGENDSPEQVEQILQLLQDKSITPRFNLVRYNPFNTTSRETSEVNIQSLFDQIQQFIKESKIVTRVGMDVNASCGMFNV